MSLFRHITLRRLAFGWSVVMAFLVITALPAEASYVTNLNDTMSVHGTSQAANHAISFVTRLGAVEGSTIAMTFASSFNMNIVAFDDIDLLVGGINRTLAANCSGTEQIGAAVSGNVITFTICPGDGGAIPASSTVTIRIGVNATFGNIGDSQIFNPSVAGSYTVSIGGSFGDRGALAIPITTRGVTITGTVPAPTPNPGGGGDSTPPIISNIMVTNITETSATVTWSTNESSTSVVDYGLTASYELGNTSVPGYTTSHTVDVTGLTRNMLYHMRVHSRDGANNEAVSGDVTFSTLPPPDATPPVISDLQVINITGTSARVVWATNEPATSSADYGPTLAYGLGTVTDSLLVVDHGMNMPGLASQTLYHIRVHSRDAAGNEAVSADQTFTTADITPPVISSVVVTDITETSARVTWDTNEPATSAVAFGRTSGYELGTMTVPGLVLAHSVSLTSLVSNTLYHLQVSGADGALNTSASADATFRTLPDRSPPANVSDFTVTETGPRAARLTWQNPPDVDFAGVRIVRRLDRFPTSPTDGTTIFEGLAAFTNDTLLSRGTTYRYAAYAYDFAGNFASGALTTFRLSDVCGDGLCGVDETRESCPADCVAPSVAVCGNDVCESGETSASCPIDCGAPVPVLCGNGVCESGETQESCPADCRGATPPVCGNGTCESDETPASCPADCRGVPSVGGDEHLELRDIHLRVANRVIELAPQGKTYDVIQGKVLWVEVLATAFKRNPTSVQFVVGDNIYPLVRTDAIYSTALLTPNSVGTDAAALLITYSDGANDRVDMNLLVKPWGRVSTRRTGLLFDLSGALVTLFENTGETWDGSMWGEENPTRARVDGSFAWYVPSGTYRLEVRADEYTTQTITVVASDAIVNPAVELIALPPPIPETVKDILSGPTSTTEKVLAIGDLIGKTVDYGSAIARQALDNPQVQDIARSAAPAAAAAAAAAAGAAVSTAGAANVARFLFTQPAVFFTRRRRKSWGVVYNAITKVPVALAVVRLSDATTGRLLQTRVTDQEGRYFFIVQPGSYRLGVQKSLFVFPSHYLKDAVRDVLHLDLYHGESVVVSERGATLAANIPIDPNVSEQVPAAIVRKIWLERVEHFVAVVSPVVAVATVIIRPTLFTAGLLVFQVAVYTLFHWLTLAKKPKGWGIVYDAQTRRPLERAIVRIFEPIYGKLLDMQMTDARGRYSFLVGPNNYRMKSEKIGYVSTTTDVDYRERKAPEVVKEDVRLNPTKPGEEWREEPV